MNLRAMMLIACWTASAAAVAQEPAPAASDSKAPAATKAPAPSAPAPSDSAAKKDDPAAKKETKAPDAKNAATKPTKDSAGTPQRFIPTEQVRSDFDVSFPVDI
ncbi:MAG: hypothetical protein ABW034_25415 [Steroidobacteraceae bacterium]